MSDPNVETKQVDELKNILENIKETNDEFKGDLEKRDALTKEKLEKMTQDFDVKLQAIEKTMNRVENASPSVKDESDKVKDFKKFNLNVRNSKEEVSYDDLKKYEGVFEKYLRVGKDLLEPEEFKLLQIASDPQGGYFVRPQYSDSIISKKFDGRAIIDLVNRVQVSSEYKQILDYNDYSDAYFTDELSDETTEADVDGFKEITIRSDEILYPQRFSRSVLEDAYVDLEAHVIGKMREGAMRKTAGYLADGNGVNKPRGLLTYGSGTTYNTVEQVETGTSAVIKWNDLLSVMSALKDDYHPNASFVMARATFLGHILKNLGGDGQYIVNIFERDNLPVSIAGYPLRFDAGMPAVASSALAVLFGDFKQAYTLTERVGYSIIRDDTNARVIKLTLRARIGGRLVSGEAMKILKCAA